MNYRNISYGILAYYWVGIGMFTMNLPTILPDNAISFLTAGCVGWLWCDHSQRGNDIAVARSRSPRLLTLVGDFSWDGVVDARTIHGRKYAILYGNGLNYDGWYERGDVAVCVPYDHVISVGQNAIVVTDIRKGSVPPNIIFEDVRAVLSGNLPSQIFDNAKVDHELDTIANERDAAIEFGAMQWQLNQDLLNSVADARHLFNMINPIRVVKQSTPKTVKLVEEQDDDDE